MLIHLNSLIILWLCDGCWETFLNQSSGLYCRGSAQPSLVEFQSAPSYLLLLQTQSLLPLQLLQLRSLSAHSGPTLIRAKINQSIILFDFYISHCLSTPLYINNSIISPGTVLLKTCGLNLRNSWSYCPCWYSIKLP